MGRAEKRKFERRNRIEDRKGKLLVSAEELADMKRKVSDDTARYDVEKLMVCFALAEHRLYGFGQKRIFRSLQYIDGLMGKILAGDTTIEDYKQELRRETGVVVTCED